MKQFFLHNWAWKVVSLVLSVILWLFVINLQNPIQSKEIKDMSVDIKGINEIKNKGYVIGNEEELRDTKVKLILNGPRLELEKLQSNKETMITVNLDLAPFIRALTTESDKIESLVDYTATTLGVGVRVEEISPKAHVTFEKEESDLLPVEFNVQGEENGQYMALDPIIKPKQVQVKGSKTLVESISKLVVDINIDNFSEDYLSYILPIKALDGEGNEVVGISKSPQYIQVTLPIGKKKIVRLEPQFKDDLPLGYIQTNTVVTPKEITIVGKSDLIDTIEKIKLETISLDDRISSYTVKADFLLPEGIEYIDDIENKAAVTVEIQKENIYAFDLLTHHMNFNVKGLANDRDYELLDTELKLVLSGAAENLLKFDKNKVDVEIDLNELQPGEYTIPVQMNVPSELKIVNTPLTLKVKIIEKEKRVAD